jgi:glycogen operon protein
MSDEAWAADFVRCLGLRLAGDLIGDLDEQGSPIVGDTLLLLLNAHHEPIPFVLPPVAASECWAVVLDTAETAEPRHALFKGVYHLVDRSLCVLRIETGETIRPANAAEYRLPEPELFVQ